MRVHVYPGDAGGCGYYRLIWPALAAAEQGHDVHIFMPDEGKIRAQCRRNSAGEEMVVGVEAPECDVVVFQRPLAKNLADLIPFIQQAGIAVVVEIDDDFHAIDPRNIAWKRTLENHSAVNNRNHLQRACRMADLVTVTTPSLIKRYGFDHGTVIPNYVPERYLSIERPPHDMTVVGWSGSVLTHPTDLQQMRSAIPILLRDVGIRFQVIGTGEGVHERVGIPKDYDLRPSGWVDIQDYPLAMAWADIGVVPLEMSLFNQAKSWLKGLEFASLGIPFLASPTDPYRSLHEKYGIGCLVSNPKHWVACLRGLIQDRSESDVSPRFLVDINDLVIERRVDEWTNAWKWAADRRTVNAGVE